MLQVYYATLQPFRYHTIVGKVISYGHFTHISLESASVAVANNKKSVMAFHRQRELCWSSQWRSY